MRTFSMLLLVGSTVVRAATFSYDILIPAVPGAPGFLATNAVEIKFASSTVLSSTVLNLQTNPAGISGFALTGSPVPGATLNFANFNAGPGDAFQIAFLAGPLTLAAGIFAPPGEHFDHTGIYNVGSPVPNQLLMGSWAVTPPPPSGFFNPTLIIAVPEPAVWSTTIIPLLLGLKALKGSSRHLTAISPGAPG